jgi:hypothetical protein
MTNYIFLTKTNTQGEEIKYYAIPENKIELLNLSETYTGFGQTVSPADAGDYLTLISQKAVDFANQAYHSNHVAADDDTEVLQKFSIGDYISAYDYSEYDEILIADDLEKEVDFSVEYTTCKGFNFWDGHNHKTIITGSYVHDFLEYEIISDKEIIKRLRTAISKMKEVSRGAGYIDYRHGSVNITESYWQGTWESYNLKIA